MNSKSSIVVFIIWLFIAQTSSALLVQTEVQDLAKNSGIAFGFLKNSNFGLVLSLTGAFFLLSFLVFRHRFLAYPAALIFAGGISNLMDRLFLGVVRDPIQLGVWVGNIADIFIAAGLVWAIILILRKNIS